MTARHTDLRDAGDLGVKVEIATDQVSEVLPLELPDRPIGLASDGRHSWLVTKQRDLAEILAGTEGRKPSRPPVFPGEYVDLPLTDDVKRVAAITLTHQWVATMKRLNGQLNGE